MKFWDSSAVVPLVAPEARSDECTALFDADDVLVVWALTPVETLSALYRKQHEGQLDEAAVQRARDRLQALREGWHEIQDLPLVRRRAERPLRLHPVRAADALQLGAALVISGEDPASLSLVSLDENLSHAARAEGFRVLPERG